MPGARNQCKFGSGALRIVSLAAGFARLKRIAAPEAARIFNFEHVFSMEAYRRFGRDIGARRRSRSDSSNCCSRASLQEGERLPMVTSRWPERRTLRYVAAECGPPRRESTAI